MKELGQRVGCSEASISYYELGKREAKYETLLKIGEALDTSVDALIGSRYVGQTLNNEKATTYKGEHDYSPALKKIVDELCVLPDDQLDKLLTLIRSAKDIL